MVDATIQTDRSLATRTGAPVGVRLVEDGDAVNALLGAIAPEAVHTSPQHPAFLRAWVSQATVRPFFVELRAAGAGPVLLPLEIDADGTARYCGGRHANGNFPVGAVADLSALVSIGTSAITAALASANLPVAAIILERQLERIGETENPLVDAQSVASPNMALSFAIDGDMDHILSTRSAKQKRKKWRSYNRKLDAMGAVTFHHPVANADTARFLDRFFALKADRFRQAGIANVFGDTETQGFFRRLFADGGPSFELHALTVDDEIAAVIGCAALNGRLTVDFGSFDARFAHARPGEVLFHSTIAHACATGFSIFDFGIGDEPYKRAWCDIETIHHDTTIALTAAGQMRAMAQRGRSRLVRAVKSNDRLWATAKSVRKRLARGS